MKPLGFCKRLAVEFVLGLQGDKLNVAKKLLGVFEKKESLHRGNQSAGDQDHKGNQEKQSRRSKNHRVKSWEDREGDSESKESVDKGFHKAKEETGLHELEI